MAFYLEGACAVETRMMMTDYWDSWASFHHVHDLSPWLFHDSSPWLFHVLYPGGLHYLLDPGLHCLLDPGLHCGCVVGRTKAWVSDLKTVG